MSANFSVDSFNNPKKYYDYVPRWTIDSIKLLIGLVYVYAGIAKINSDWLLEASPLKIWLSSKGDLPILGETFEMPWVYIAFSWIGMLYDISIPFLLLWRRTRIVGFLLVVTFHLLTKVLFPIGLFPYIMIVSAIIFFSPHWHNRVIQMMKRALPLQKSAAAIGNYRMRLSSFPQALIFSVLALFFAYQIVFPWRYLLYPGELFWTEEGYRFSWRVMLMEKAGYAQFKIVENDTGKSFYVDNTNFLTPLQEKQMVTQPDLILQYAHHLGQHYKQGDEKNISIYVESYVGLNGRPSRPYINPTVNLLHYKDSFDRKTFILTFQDAIKGF